MPTAALSPPASPRLPVLAAIVGLHLLLIAAWQGSRWVVTRHAEPVGALVAILPPAAPRGPAPLTAPPPTARWPAPQRAPMPAPTAAEPMLTVRVPAATSESPETPEPPEAPASQPRQRLLDGEATRRAIREAGRQPLLAERTEAATGIALVSRGERLSEDVTKAGKGDCLKGDYAFSGGGLLSLPALAYAAATGQCAK